MHFHLKASESDEEIPQSQTAGLPTLPWGRDKEHSVTATWQQEDEENKATGFLFFGDMIVKLSFGSIRRKWIG